jgi:hypothetical protein
MNGRRKKGGKNKENENGDEWPLFFVAQQVIMANKYMFFFLLVFQTRKGRIVQCVLALKISSRGGEKNSQNLSTFRNVLFKNFP